MSHWSGPGGAKPKLSWKNNHDKPITCSGLKDCRQPRHIEFGEDVPDRDHRRHHDRYPSASYDRVIEIWNDDRPRVHHLNLQELIVTSLSPNYVRKLTMQR